MTVFEITVDGIPDHVIDVDDIASWVQAANAVEQALAGRTVQVAAYKTAGRNVNIDPPIFFNAQTVVDQ